MGKLSEEQLEEMQDKIENGKNLGRDFWTVYVIQMIKTRELQDKTYISKEDIDNIVGTIYEDDELWENIDYSIIDILNNYFDIEPDTEDTENEEE